MTWTDFGTGEATRRERFHRPNGTILFRLVNRFLPPAPRSHPLHAYGNLKHQFKFKHYLLGLPLLAAFVAITVGEIWLLPFMLYSPATLAFMAAAWLWKQFSWGALAFAPLVPGGVWALWRLNSRYKQDDIHYSHIRNVGILNRAAIVEEQWFREGAENWSWWQRLSSCVCFGVVHMGNLIYPLSTILPLSLGGYLFMRVYLHNYKQHHDQYQAVLASALVHRVYNRLALIVVGIAILHLILSAFVDFPPLGL